MQPSAFAAAFARRVNQQPDLSAPHADWNIFCAMLRATAPYVPARLRFDADGLKYAKDSLSDAERWAAQITPREAARLTTPYEVTLQRDRDALRAVYILRAIWKAFIDLFAAQDACDGHAEEQALVRLVAFSHEYPQVYWRFNLYFQTLARSEAPAALTEEYQRFDEYFRPPDTWTSNGGSGFYPGRHIFPPYKLKAPSLAAVVLAEHLVFED